ncbi:hypothetical protein GYH30_046632 [Glycine max]|uniref:Uncharacterized protein n=1 Tax=Glycine max TaxID=3847 RepID=A0A0R0FIM7_SOYBN|nr:hypothetical protein GYH30_046632 [Glycine max]
MHVYSFFGCYIFISPSFFSKRKVKSRYDTVRTTYLILYDWISKTLKQYHASCSV